MAADAIARQYDVDKNRVILVCEPGKTNYRPGIITFFPKTGKSIDLRKMEESLRATRLSGGTGMSMNYLEITATGEVVDDDRTVLLKVSGTTQRFILLETKDSLHLSAMRKVLASGAKIVSVTGRVDGWSGGFPVVLRALKQQPAEAPAVLVVTDFETSKK